MNQPLDHKSQSQEFDGFDTHVVSEKIIGACILCGGTDLKLFASGYDYEIQTCINEWKFKKYSA